MASFASSVTMGGARKAPGLIGYLSVSQFTPNISAYILPNPRLTLNEYKADPPWLVMKLDSPGSGREKDKCFANQVKGINIELKLIANIG